MIWIYLFGDEKRICNGRCWTFRWCLVPRRTIRYLQNHRMDLGRLMASRPATSCYLDTCRAFPNLGEPRKRRGSTGRNGEYIENWWVQKVWDQPPMSHYRMEPLFNSIGWVLPGDHAGLGRPHVVAAWGSWSGRVRTWLSSRLQKCSGNGRLKSRFWFQENLLVLNVGNFREWSTITIKYY